VGKRRNPSLFEGYTKGHGIIASRERFLQWLETDEGKRVKKKAETDKGATQPPSKKFGKTIIMPIAVPGVGMSHPLSTRGVGLELYQGKTSIAVALKELFKFAHTQGDDVRAKRLVPFSFRMSRDSCETMMSLLPISKQCFRTL